MVDEAALTTLESECTEAQAAVVEGRLSERYGTAQFLEQDGAQKAEKFANYVQFITEVSPATRDAILRPEITATMRRLLGDDCWLLESRRSGVLYQDARPGRESGYTRIGWHSDWQSAPAQPMWPSTAFTLHVDGTSPANGFLRVVPGSHQWATPAPYENVNGARRCPKAPPPPPATPTPRRRFRCHSASRRCPARSRSISNAATSSSTTPTSGIPQLAPPTTPPPRRHVRGSWFTGVVSDEGIEEFVKNAAR